MRKYLKKELTVQEVLAKAKTARIQPIYTPGNLSSEKDMKKVLLQVMDGLERDFGSFGWYIDAKFSEESNHIAIAEPRLRTLNLILAWLMVNSHTRSSFFPLLPALIIDEKYVIEIDKLYMIPTFDEHPHCILSIVPKTSPKNVANDLSWLGKSLVTNTLRNYGAKPR